KTTPHGRKLKREEAAKHLADFILEMKSHLSSVSIHVYIKADGEFAPDLLGDLAALIGVGAEICAVKLPGSAEAKRLHAALRTVLAMSISGRRWQFNQAKPMHEVAEMATLLYMKWPALGLSVSLGALELAQEVRAGTSRMDAVAGAELYNAVQPPAHRRLAEKQNQGSEK
ncbi:MAG: hypothetical protein JWP96_1093, partial [Polaromonas sp.]|nr:hypothetical protein [Polaromonas sp.]